MKFLTILMSLFSFSTKEDIPKEDGKLKLTDEQNTKLQDLLGDDKFEKFIKGVNKEITLAEKTAQADDVKAQILDLLEKENPDISAEDKDKATKGDKPKDVSLSETVTNLITEMKALKASNLKMSKDIEKLSAEDENIPETINMKDKKIPIKHSATHLFASGKSWDEFENRPWNKAIRSIMDGNISAASTLIGFNDYKNLQPVVEQLNSDLDEYYTENPQVLRNLDFNTFGLPTWWTKRNNVVHSVRDAGIRTDEITQARKAGWAPKNNQFIEVEERQVYPIQIDAEWQGIRLQTLAETWMQNFMNSGSSAQDQTSFVMYLINGLNMQREKEDNQHQIDGVYVKVPDQTNGTGSGLTAVSPGMSKYRQNGLMLLNWLYRDVTKQIRPFRHLGVPVSDNIKEYMPKYIKSMPAYLQNTNGLTTYMSWELFIEYNKQNSEVETLKNMLQNLVNMSSDDIRKLDYTKYIGHVKGYPNQRICPLPQIGDSKVIFTTFDNNVEILENNPKEKANWTFDKLKRDLFAYVDYKIGVGYVYVGQKNISESAKDKYQRQFVWMNDQPIFSEDMQIPAYDFGTSTLKLNYNKAYISDGFSTDITDIKLGFGKDNRELSFAAGQIVYITGNDNLTGTSPKIKKVTGKLDLASDWVMKTPGSLILLSQGDGKFKELSRTSTAPTVSEDSLEFSMDTFDASLGDEYTYVGVDALTLADITGGVEGQIITIIGNEDETLTITNNENISIGTNVLVTKASGVTGSVESVQLIFANGIWYKY